MQKKIISELEWVYHYMIDIRIVFELYLPMCLYLDIQQTVY